MKLMKKITILTIIAIILLSSIVIAEEIVPELYKEQSSEGQKLCDYILEKLNIEIGTSVPKLIPYSNERLNIYTAEKELVGHLILEDGIVTSYNCEETDNPTYNVTIMSKSTIDDILNSENMIKGLNRKLNNKEIDLVGMTYSKKIKGFFTRLGLNIASVFI